MQTSLTFQESREITGNCSVCNQPANEKKCPRCGVPYHLTCWNYNQGCAVYGCSSSCILLNTDTPDPLSHYLVWVVVCAVSWFGIIVPLFPEIGGLSIFLWVPIFFGTNCSVMIARRQKEATVDKRSKIKPKQITPV